MTTPIEYDGLLAILAAAEKASAGPWSVATDYPALAIAAGKHRVVQTPNQNNFGQFGRADAWHGVSSEANAAFIAACDPQTITAIITELLSLRSSPAMDGVGEPVGYKAVTSAGKVLWFDADEPPSEPSWAITPLYTAPTSSDRASVVEADNQFAEYEGVTAKELAETVARYGVAMKEACDLLAERKYGSPARSPGHNARVTLESALSPRSS